MDAASLRTNEEIEEIYTNYADMVYRISFLALQNAAEAEDAVQTVFLRLMQYQKPFDSGEHLKAWLIVTAKNVCRDVLKSFWRKKTTAMDGVPEQICRDGAAGETYAAVMALPEKYRILLYLYYFEGYSTQELAALLGVNHSTVRSRLCTARRKLKLFIEEEHCFE